MSYTDGGFIQQDIVKSGSLVGTGDITGAVWAPGYQPVIVRAASVVLTVALACAATVKLDKRPTPGSDSGRGDGDVAVITLPNGQAAGTVVYKDQLNVKVSPGEEIVAEVTDAGGGSAAGHIAIHIEPSFEIPANNTEMTESA